MSASEKLKAMEERAEGRWDNDLDGEPLLMALPQIRAVVEAAERHVEYDPDYADVNDPNPLAAALAALEKALS